MSSRFGLVTTVGSFDRAGHVYDTSIEFDWEVVDRLYASSQVFDYVIISDILHTEYRALVEPNRHSKDLERSLGKLLLLGKTTFIHVANSNSKTIMSLLSKAIYNLGADVSLVEYDNKVRTEILFAEPRRVSLSTEYENHLSSGLDKS